MTAHRRKETGNVLFLFCGRKVRASKGSVVGNAHPLDFISFLKSSADQSHRDESLP